MTSPPNLEQFAWMLASMLTFSILPMLLIGMKLKSGFMVYLSGLQMIALGVCNTILDARGVSTFQGAPTTSLFFYGLIFVVYGLIWMGPGDDDKQLIDKMIKLLSKRKDKEDHDDDCPGH